MSEDDSSSASGEEYIEEVIDSDSENDYVEEVVSSDEDESEKDDDRDSSDDDDDDDDDDSSEDDVDLESIDDDDDGVDDGGDDSHSEFDPLPPPIEIPDALKPPHLRAKPASFYAVKDDDISINSDDSSDDSSYSSSDGGFGQRVKKVIASAAGSKKPSATKKSSFDYDDDVDVSSDTDTSLSSTEKPKKPKSNIVASVTGKINKNAEDYDEDDTEDEAPTSTTTTTTSTKPEKEEPTPSSPKPATTISESPISPIRPTCFRGHSFDELPDNAAETEKRGGKKPESNSSEPVDSPEKVKENEPPSKKAPVIKKIVTETPQTEPSSLRDSSTVKNEPIQQTSPPQSPEKVKSRFKPIPIKKNEEQVEKEEDWNTEPKDDGNGPYYSYEDLKKKKIPDLDYLNREKYLSPYDFMAVFKVKKSEFATWPKWKQTKAKRTAKLF